MIRKVLLLLLRKLKRPKDPLWTWVLSGMVCDCGHLFCDHVEGASCLHCECTLFTGERVIGDEMAIAYTENQHTVSFEIYPHKRRHYKLLKRFRTHDPVRVGYNVRAFWMTPELTRVCKEHGVSDIEMGMFNELECDNRVVLIHVKGGAR